MPNKIQFKRGLKAELPALADGEPGFCTDSKEFYIGNGSGGNTRIPTETDYIRQPGYGDTAGTANTYTVTLNPALSVYTSGVALAVKINAANTGAATLNVNGLGAKNILNSKGAALAAGKLVVGGVYTLRYNGTAFILQGEGGDYGTATAAEVLAGRTVGTENGLVTGTMPNNGTKVYTPSSGNVPIDAGYHVGSVVAAVAVPADKVLAGTTIAGTAGTMVKKQGTIPAQGTAKWDDGALAVYPSQGYYKGGSGDGEIKVSVDQLRAAEPNLIKESIKAGISLFGISGDAWTVWTGDVEQNDAAVLSGNRYWAYGNKRTGTMPNRSAEASHQYRLEQAYWAPGTSSNPYPRLFLRPPHGYYNGSTWVYHDEPNLVPANVRAGVGMFGLTGNLVEGSRYASGSTVSSKTQWFFDSVSYNGNISQYPSYFLEVGGLNFPNGIDFIWCLRSRTASIYESSTGFLYSFDFDINQTGVSIQYVQNSGGAYASTTGFKIPVWRDGLTYQWGVKGK